jgi:hypothetical protein
LFGFVRSGEVKVWTFHLRPAGEEKVSFKIPANGRSGKTGGRKEEGRKSAPPSKFPSESIFASPRGSSARTISSLRILYVVPLMFCTSKEGERQQKRSVSSFHSTREAGEETYDARLRLLLLQELRDDAESAKTQAKGCKTRKRTFSALLFFAGFAAATSCCCSGCGVCSAVTSSPPSLPIGVPTAVLPAPP